MALFESYERRIDKINAVLNSYGISSIEEAEKITKDSGLDVYDQVKKIQPICFENACWAYTVGAAIAIKKGCRKASEAAAAIGEGLQAFCIPGSVSAKDRMFFFGCHFFQKCIDFFVNNCLIFDRLNQIFGIYIREMDFRALFCCINW